MKKLVFILSIFCFTAINGQNVFTITSGAEIFGATLTLENMDLNNESYWTRATIRFSGNINSTISGVGPYGNGNGIYYDGFDIAKTGGAKLILQSQNVHAHGAVIFTSGYLDLNGNVLCLFTHGGLVNESEYSRIIGPSGGYVQYKHHPGNTVPGWSTGVTCAYLDSITGWVRRGHITHTGNLGTGSGIQRYFQISDVESGSQNPISVRMKYFGSELNGLNENDLVFWSSSDMINWTNHGFTTRNTTDNYVELSNITNFQDKHFTLASPGYPLRPITSAPQQIKTIAVPGKETIVSKWKTWPNPATKILWIDITSTSSSQATTSIFDSKGSLIRTQTNHLIEGANRLKMDLKNLAAGIYYITTTWDAGKQKRSSSFVKL